MRLSAYSVLSTIEAWITGYKSEHLQLGLQQGICQAIALMPVLINQFFVAVDRGGSALFIAVTVAVVLEPSTGDAFRKLMLRLMAAGVSGGISLLVLYIAVGDNFYDYDTYYRELAAWIVPSVAIFSFVYATNQQRYLHQREFWSVALLTLPIVIVPAVRAPADTFYSGAAFRMLDVVLGIGLAAVVSFFVFPVRARSLLQKKMASTLIRVGDLAVWLLGQACVPPAPGTGGSMPGRSATDKQCLYTDDGLRARLAPLMQTTNRLADDISSMWKLLEAANAEFRFLPPHRFPTEQYRNLLHSCHVSMGIFYTLINAMQCGDVSLATAQHHIGNLSEAGVRLSAGFTALGSMIRPPKAKKGAKKGWKRWGKKRKAAAAGEAAGGAAAAAASGGAATAQPQQQQQHRGGCMRPQSSLAAPLVGDVEAAAGAAADAADAADDPFAEMEAEGSDGALSPPPVVGLSDSQLLSAQQMARHLSQVMVLHSSGEASGGGGGSSSVHGSRHGGEPLSPLEESSLERRHDDGEAGGDGNGVAVAAPAADGANKPSLGASTLAGAGTTSGERRDWVLAKLQALVDAVQQLEAASLREREEHQIAGLHSFLLLTHAVVNLTRQCGACFTALDPERGSALHQYFQAARTKTYPPRV